MEIEFKPGDRVILPSGIEAVIDQVEMYARGKLSDGFFLIPTTDLKPAPEPPITDAERVAAMSHNHFGKLRQGMTGFFLESSLSTKPFGGNTATEALDAWVRHLRSTGWKAGEGE